MKKKVTKKVIIKTKLKPNGNWFEDLEGGIGHYFENGETYSICRKIYFDPLLNQQYPRLRCSDCERRLSSNE